MKGTFRPTNGIGKTGAQAGLCLQIPSALYEELQNQCSCVLTRVEHTGSHWTARGQRSNVEDFASKCRGALSAPDPGHLLPTAPRVYFFGQLGPWRTLQVNPDDRLRHVCSVLSCSYRNSPPLRMLLTTLGLTTHWVSRDVCSSSHGHGHRWQVRHRIVLELGINKFIGHTRMAGNRRPIKSRNGPCEPWCVPRYSITITRMVVLCEPPYLQPTKQPSNPDNPGTA